VVVSAGATDPEEMLRRLNNGIWIDEFLGGSVEIASGSFRLRFPRARRVRRGRFADELGPGVLAGELLTTLQAIEPALGREVRACRSLGWCARAGQVVPVGGASPDLLIRRLGVRPQL
jgi:TldD protein